MRALRCITHTVYVRVFFIASHFGSKRTKTICRSCLNSFCGKSIYFLQLTLVHTCPWHGNQHLAAESPHPFYADIFCIFLELNLIEPTNLITRKTQRNAENACVNGMCKRAFSISKKQRNMENACVNVMWQLIFNDMSRWNLMKIKGSSINEVAVFREASILWRQY